VSEEATESLTDLMLNFDDYSFNQYLLWDRKPKICIEKAYRPTGGSLSAKQYLDYVLVESKELNLDILQQNRTSPQKIRIYTNSFKRSFPDKFFKKFPLGSHTYFFGKYEDLDVYILFKPNDPDGFCNCSTVNGFVTETVASIFFNEVLLPALSK
jgi:hypothetical protein